MSGHLASDLASMCGKNLEVWKHIFNSNPPPGKARKKLVANARRNRDSEP